ncbi:hypothetical protein D3C79_839830 [compost metagenome]
MLYDNQHPMKHGRKFHVAHPFYQLVHFAYVKGKQQLLLQYSLLHLVVEGVLYVFEYHFLQIQTDSQAPAGDAICFLIL